MSGIQVINPIKKLSQFNEYWSPKIIADLNDSYVKLAKFEGEYIWHKHDHEDELFLVINGELAIELRDKTVTIKTGEMIVIPKGVEHKPVAKSKEVAVMLIEPKATISTGDAENTEDKQSTHGEWI